MSEPGLTTVRRPHNRIFFPEDYGAVGDGAVDDKAAIQRTVDAATLAGGGLIILSGTYAISYTATTTMGNYSTPYGVWVNASNIAFQGPGTIVPHTAAQDYILIVFGNGGAPTSHPGELGTWTYHVGIEGVKFDGTGFTGQNVTAIAFAYCKGFWAINCDIRAMPGRGIYGFATDRDGRIIGNVVVDSQTASHTYEAIYVDGGSHCVVQGNYVNCPNGGPNIKLQANNDNEAAGVCTRNAVVGNVLDDPYNIGIVFAGCQYSSIVGNYIWDAPTAGIKLDSYSSAIWEAESSWNLVAGNYIARSSVTGTAIDLQGDAVSAYDGLPLYCRLNFIGPNYIGPNYVTKFSINAQALQNTVLADNVWDTVGAFADGDATPSVVGFNVWKTANTNPTAITMLDDGWVGQQVTVIVNDANTTVDFTGTNLKGNGGADWSPASGDFMVCWFDGTDWYCEVHAT